VLYHCMHMSWRFGFIVLVFRPGSIVFEVRGGFYCIVAAADNDDICNLSTLLSICTVTAI
jgi:hypothetical protein